MTTPKLPEPVQEPVKWAADTRGKVTGHLHITQEPVAWAQKGYEYVSLTPDQYHTEPLYAAPQSAEPVNQMLLEALKRVRNWGEGDRVHYTGNHPVAQARAAIAAAEGKV